MCISHCRVILLLFKSLSTILINLLDLTYTIFQKKNTTISVSISGLRFFPTVCVHTLPAAAIDKQLTYKVILLY